MCSTATITLYNIKILNQHHNNNINTFAPITWTACYTVGPAKKKKCLQYDTKEIKMKIQAPSSECNTRYTVKPIFRKFPHTSFVWCPYLTMVVYAHFNNKDLSN